jgi:hypothetical protein
MSRSLKVPGLSDDPGDSCCPCTTSFNRSAGRGVDHDLLADGGAAVIEALLLLLVGVVVIGVIIAANGYFLAQEFAYMSVDRVRLQAQAKAGDAAAARALKITRRTSFMLSGPSWASRSPVCWSALWPNRWSASPSESCWAASGSRRP